MPQHCFWKRVSNGYCLFSVTYSEPVCFLTSISCPVIFQAPVPTFVLNWCFCNSKGRLRCISVDTINSHKIYFSLKMWEFLSLIKNEHFLFRGKFFFLLGALLFLKKKTMILHETSFFLRYYFITLHKFFNNFIALRTHTFLMNILEPLHTCLFLGLDTN